jgi:hypothetical protein
MPKLLLELWREQHPKGHEQVQLDFTSRSPWLNSVLFSEMKSKRGHKALWSEQRESAKARGGSSVWIEPFYC